MNNRFDPVRSLDSLLLSCPLPWWECLWLLLTYWQLQKLFSVSKDAGRTRLTWRIQSILIVQDPSLNMSAKYIWLCKVTWWQVLRMSQWVIYRRMVFYSPYHTESVQKLLFKRCMGTGEMTQWVKALAEKVNKLSSDHPELCTKPDAVFQALYNPSVSLLRESIYVIPMYPY